MLELSLGGEFPFPGAKPRKVTLASDATRLWHTLICVSNICVVRELVGTLSAETILLGVVSQFCQ